MKPFGGVMPVCYIFKLFLKGLLPKGYPQPDHDLDYYEQLVFPYAPGIGGNQ
jgi:hypothetical protein